MWLNLLQKVPTWDYLQEKQKYRASLYYLCKMESKDVTHIFTSYCYSVECQNDVSNQIDTIMPQSKAFQSIHYISIWSICPMQNFSQFEGRIPPPFQVSSHVIVTAQFYYSQGNPSKPQIIGKLTVDKTFTWMEHAKGMIICRIGGILFLHKQHYFHLISNAGQGTKN